MNTHSAGRDYLFDNYKAILIFLVIVSHFTDLCYTNNGFLYAVKWIIVSFHMPAFIFISGYFSKRQASLRTLIQKLLVPYLVYECVYYFLYTLILDRQTGLYLLYPKFSLWYILALFIWRLTAPYVKKIPGYMAVAIAAGLLIGLSGMKDNFLTLPRILVYYPFFLAGTQIDRAFFDRFRNRRAQLLSAAGLTACAAFFILDPLHRRYDPKIFYGRYNYEYLGQTPLEGILVRLLCYAAGFAITFLIAFVLTERRTVFSYIGQRTMPIYILHGLVYSCFKYGSSILQSVDAAWETCLLLLLCALLVFIGAWQPLYRITERIASFPIPRTLSLFGSSLFGFSK